MGPLLEPGDYAVFIEDGSILLGRIYPEGEQLRLREYDHVDGEWGSDHEVDAYPGPWARFPDGTFD